MITGISEKGDLTGFWGWGSTSNSGSKGSIIALKDQGQATELVLVVEGGYLSWHPLCSRGGRSAER